MCESCGVKVYSEWYSCTTTGVVVVVVGWYSCTAVRLYWWVVLVGGWGLVLLYYSVNPVAPGVMGMSFSVFSGLGVGLGLQVDSPRRIPTNSQVILSGSPFNDHLQQQHFTVRIYFRSPLSDLECHQHDEHFDVRL